MTEITRNKAAELRGSFDGSFALERADATIETVDFLTIEVGGAPHAIRLSEVAGVFAARKITRLPGRAPELVGIAGFRGAIIPVFDLAQLLGYARAGEVQRLAIAESAAAAFSFSDHGKHLRVPRVAVATSSVERAHVREVVTTAERAWAVISVPSLVAVLARSVKES